MAELASVSGRRGEAGGDGYGERRRRWFSGERERAGGEEEGEREGVRAVRGSAWQRSGRPGVEGEDRQAGAVAARRCARAGHTPLASWREVEDDWHGQLAGPASWAAQCQASGEHR